MPRTQPPIPTAAHYLSAAMPATSPDATRHRSLTTVTHPEQPQSPPPPALTHHPIVSGYPWHYSAYHPALTPVLPAVQAFVSDVLHGRPPRRWLSLLGPSGIGKTYILRQALACLRRAQDRGQWKIRTATGQRGPQIAHLVPAEDLQDWRAPRDYAHHDVIYLEDIGSGSALDAGAGKVLRSRITELLQLRSGKWTLLCANLHRGQIADHLDHRIASRLKRDTSTCLELPYDVPDYWE